MSVSHPAFHRLSKVYVQVPSSPHPLSARRAHHAPVHPSSSTKLKENAPVRPSMDTSASTSALHKRKASERDAPSLVLDGVVITSKKAKLSSGALKPTQAHTDHLSEDASNDASKFTYCHQCNKKRDVEDTIRCTVVDQFLKAKDKSIRERPCVNKYCKSCLMNRYGENFDSLKSSPGCHFKCPRCRDICNCPRCRKSKGLEPTGAMPKAKAKEADGPPKQKSNKSKETASSKSKAAKKVAERALPAVVWTKIPTNLSYDEITERIFIREFFLRFGDIMEPPLARTHSDELEALAGRKHQSGSEDAHGWVSDMCVKALVVSLLGLLARAHPDDTAKLFRNAIKDVRAASANLNKMWAALSSLQEEIESSSHQTATSSNPGDAYESSFSVDSPSELPAESAAPRRSLRAIDDRAVVLSSQMIPVVISLINHALRTRLLRDDIEQASKDVKDWQPVVRDALKLENERWEADRDTITSPKNQQQKAENKAKRNLHKQQLENIENCLKIVTPYYAPRFMSLGVDDEKREYFALSPSVAEREAASEYLDVAASARPMKCKKKGRVLPEEERSELRDWSWFVGVYGKKPPGALDGRPPGAVQDDDDEGDTDGPRWWGFSDPKEINKLAEWITIKSGFEVEDESSKNESDAAGGATNTTTTQQQQKAPLSPREAQLKRLIGGLKEYAALLEWRVNPEKCHLVRQSFADLQGQK